MRYITPNAARSATGIPAATQKATRALRNKNKQAQNDGKALQAVLDQDHKALHDKLAAHIVHGDLQGRRQGGTLLLQVVIENFHRPQRVGPLCALDVDLDGWLAAHEADLAFALKSRVNFSDVSGRTFLPIRARLDLYIADGLRGLAFGAGAKLDFGLAFQFACWQVLGVLANPFGDVLIRSGQGATSRLRVSLSRSLHRGRH